MNPILNETELRVLGSLIEKEITTPDYYPLSLNALAAACNQTSNRSPVTHLDEDSIVRALDTLRDKGAVHMVDRGDSRVVKYRHVVYEAWDLGRPAVAILCVMMLRGPQTLGEIRTRTNRLYDFSSLDEIEIVLGSLMSGEAPRVLRLPRQPGQKEVRYAHLLGGEVHIPEPETAGHVEPPAAAGDDRIAKLEREVEDLKRQFEEFRRQFE